MDYISATTEKSEFYIYIYLLIKVILKTYIKDTDLAEGNLRFF